MPAILADFLIVALTVLISASLTMVLDALLIPLNLIGAGILRLLLVKIENSAIFEPLFIEMGVNTPAIGIQSVTSNVVEIPAVIIPLGFLIYLACTSILAIFDVLRGKDENVTRAILSGFYVLGVYCTFAVLINIYASVVGQHGGDYNAVIQYAIPSQAAEIVPNPPLLSLISIVLHAATSATSQHVFRLPTSIYILVSIIAGITYLLAAGSAAAHLVIYTVVTFIQFVARILVFPIGVIIPAAPLLERVPKIGRVIRYLTGIVFLSVFVIPFITAISNGGAWSVPTATALFVSGITNRVSTAITLLQDKDNYVQEDFCAALALSDEDCSLFGDPDRAIPNTAQNILAGAFAQLALQAITSACILGAMQTILSLLILEGGFAGYMVGGIAMSMMAVPDVPVSKIVEREFIGATKATGRVGRLNGLFSDAIADYSYKRAKPAVKVTTSPHSPSRESPERRRLRSAMRRLARQDSEQAQHPRHTTRQRKRKRSREPYAEQYT